MTSKLIRGGPLSDAKGVISSHEKRGMGLYKQLKTNEKNKRNKKF